MRAEVSWGPEEASILAGMVSLAVCTARPAPDPGVVGGPVAPLLVRPAALGLLGANAFRIPCDVRRPR